jgi:integrase
VDWRALRTSHALKLAKDAQDQMRHSGASTTLDIYQRFVPESQQKVVDRFHRNDSTRPIQQNVRARPQIGKFVFSSGS